MEKSVRKIIDFSFLYMHCLSFLQKKLKILHEKKQNQKNCYNT